MATLTGDVEATIEQSVPTPSRTGGQTRAWSTVWSGKARLRHAKRVTWREAAAGEVLSAPYLLIIDAAKAPSLGNNWDLYRVGIGGVYYNVIEVAEYATTVQLWLEVQR